MGLGRTFEGLVKVGSACGVNGKGTRPMKLGDTLNRVTRWISEVWRERLSRQVNVFRGVSWLTEGYVKVWCGRGGFKNKNSSMTSTASIAMERGIVQAGECVKCVPGSLKVMLRFGVSTRRIQELEFGRNFNRFNSREEKDRPGW